VIDAGRAVDQLRSLGIDLFTGVPDSLLKHFCAYVMDELPRENHILAANEGNAVAIAMGHFLRTRRPALVYLQNSGFGNTVNPLVSLADPDVYGIPMVLLVGWRGQPGVPDEPQHRKQGRVMTVLLDALEIPWSVLPKDPQEAARTLEEAVDDATAGSRPRVVLVERDTFAPHEGDGARHGPTGRGRHDIVSREEALVALVDAVGDEAIFVSTTGMLSRELFEYRERRGGSGDRDFLTVGGMGHCSSIALGIATRERDREVWCLDGDGALLMHLGSLGVIADHAPPTFFHVVFNNGVHDSVGGQPTSVHVVDVPRVAEALGYTRAQRERDPSAVASAVDRMRAAGGPTLLELEVLPGNRPDIGRPTRTPAEGRDAFMAALSAAPGGG
jgi:phosphonopyruvate decarboxylase